MSDDNRDRVSRLVRKLPRSLEPPRDLWPGIEEATGRGPVGKRIGHLPPHPARRALPFLAAAAALLLVVCSALLLPRLAIRLRGLPGERASAGAEQALRTEVAALANQVRAAERQYRDARSELMDGLRGLGGLVSQEQLARLEREFARTDEIIAELWDQAREDPESLGPVYQLAMLYDAQTGVVRKSARYVLDRAR